MMMPIRRWLVPFALPVALAACGQSTVRFQEAQSAPKAGSTDANAASQDEIARAAVNGAYVFNIPVSQVSVRKIQSDQKTPPAKAGDDTGGASSIVEGTDGSKYLVLVNQVESDLTLRAFPTIDAVSKNEFGISKVANSDIPVAVSNTFTDLTASRIQELGSLVGTLVAIAKAHPTLPRECNITAIVIDKESTIHSAGYNPQEPNCNLVILDSNTSNSRQKDIVQRSYFKSHFVENGGMGTPIWPVTACRNVAVAFYGNDNSNKKSQNKPNKKPIFKTDIRIIDPDYIRLVQLPQKGKIAMHPVCGADVTNDPVDRWSTTFDAINNVAQQIKNNVKK